MALHMVTRGFSSVWGRLQTRSYASSFSSELLKAATAEGTSTATPTTLASAQPHAKHVFTTGNFRVSPRKLNLLSRLIRGMSMEQAALQMKFSLKRPALRVGALLHRASCAMKHNYGITGPLKIEQSWVGKGTYLKRLNIHGRGRMDIKHRPSAHLKIVVSPLPPTPTLQEQEVQTLLKAFKRYPLFRPLVDTKPLHFHEPVWSRKPFKYITSPKWTDPNVALARK